MPVSDIFNSLRLGLSQSVKLSTMLMLQVLIVLYRPDIVDRENRVNPVQPSQIKKVYDYVIIGAGSAGSILANRLTENENWTVLLLEAGPDELLLTQLPIMYLSDENKLLDWQFQTESSDNYCLSFKNHKCDYQRGKALGGTSAINSMLYVRGNRNDYDRWAAAGNPGWDYESVLPYFKKSENMTIPELKDSPYHQTGGYMTIEYFNYQTLVTSYVIQAHADAGLDLMDINGVNQTGITYSTATLRGGVRCSASRAFLRPARTRKNLDISINTMVDRILIDETTKTAYGVEFHIRSQSYKVEARREVILSAGAIQSPQLLMLSGVGPKQHLEEMGIDAILDSPGVGQNFQDHVVAFIFTYLIDTPANYEDQLTPIFGIPLALAYNPAEAITPITIEQFLLNQSCPLYANNIFEAISHNNSKYQDPSKGYPDVQIFWGSTTSTGNNGKPQVGYTAIPVVTQPRSRGYIKLQSKDSSVQPIIVPNYFSDPHDMDVLVEGMKMIHALKDTKTMRQLNARANLTAAPGCEEYQYESDDYWKCQLRYYSSPGVHASSTCKMGPANDTMAVVDPRLRVYGIKKLRVIDASIMPNITNGNTNAPTLMLAEKGADLIKEDAAQE